ncbi:hypothetical protein QWZ13_16485 [Reinekea marina]|uniref:hypothetical protein n=1 Tax=Reinekea marina TaxID=1310421 RepID=UPI0025B5A5E6|nr:hypothetical protein [Reinekea marina]MDN3650506.1 hypothetical protein [Reinekea marina]
MLSRLAVKLRKLAPIFSPIEVCRCLFQICLTPKHFETTYCVPCGFRSKKTLALAISPPNSYQKTKQPQLP